MARMRFVFIRLLLPRKTHGTHAHLGYAVSPHSSDKQANFSLPCQMTIALVEEADDLAGNVLSPRLLVVHDARGGGDDNVTELTRWQKLDDPLLEITELHVVTRADDTGLVETR